MQVGALIPCRKGSKGIPGKNFKDFCGKPLWQWALGAAMKSNVFDKIIVSSNGGLNGDHPVDSRLIFDNERPEEFATDEARLDSLLCYYAITYPEIELWCILQPTSPLRKANDIKKAFNMIKGEKYDSLLSVYNEKGFYWIKDIMAFMGRKVSAATYHIDKRPNRQDRKNWFAENGAIYFTKKYALEASRHRCGGQVGLYIMPKERSYEIDEPTDWLICETLMKRRRS